MIKNVNFFLVLELIFFEFQYIFRIKLEISTNHEYLSYFFCQVKHSLSGFHKEIIY